MFHISYFTLPGNEICLRYVRIAGGCFGSFQGIVKHTLKTIKTPPARGLGCRQKTAPQSLETGCAGAWNLVQ